MAQVITFENYLPAARYDSIPWTQVDIEEAALSTGTWALIETVALSPVDADPSNPAYRDVTTELASDTAALWYRLTFRDATGDSSQPTQPIQNVAEPTIYSSVAELARILKIRTPSAEQVNAMDRVLLAAAGEISDEIDLEADSVLSGAHYAIAAQVNLHRAAELWYLQEVPLGVAGLGSEFGSTHLARNSWDKYAFTLAPLKEQWGLA